MLGSLLQSIMFMSQLVGLAVVVPFLTAYAARCLLVIINGTAAGNDEMSWPDDSFLDWVRGSFRVLGLLAVCLVPAGFVARGLGAVWMPQDPELRFAVLALPAVWLFFPLCLLSTLAAQSPWMVFHPSVVLQLLRLTPAALTFYLTSALLLVVSLAAWRLCLFGAWGAALPLVAALGGAAVLIYARLLGRLAWLAGRVELPARRSRRKAWKKGKNQRKSPKTEVTDPWATPADDETEADLLEEDAEQKDDDEYPELNRLGVEGYDLGVQGPPPVPSVNTILGKRERGRPEPEKKPAEEYPEMKRMGVTGYSVGAGEPPRPVPMEELVNREVVQRQCQERMRPEYVPAHPMFTGVYSFPLYPTCLKAWIWLTLGEFLVGFFALGLMRFFPGR